MPLKVSLSLFGAMLVAVAIILGSLLYRTVSTEHNGWDIFAPVATTTEPLAVEPADLLTKDDKDSIDHVVRETRTYGIPWSIWVVSREELGNDLPADEVAQDRYDETPVESTEGAGDGLLMVVIVPEDHTKTEVAFVTGPDFYPKGGITPERFDYIIGVQMAPLIEEGKIGEAVIEGATWVEWTQLFLPTPDQPATDLQTGLGDLLEPIGALAFGALTALVLAAAAVAAFLTWRGSGAISPAPVTALLAAATTRGRVDHAVLAGMVLDAADRGLLRFEDGQYLPAADPATTTGVDAIVFAEASDMTREGISTTPRNLVRSLERRTGARGYLEDSLARAGLFDPRSPVFTMILRTVSAVGLALGAVGLVLSVLGESDLALATSLSLAVVSLATLLWNERRSWATRLGRHDVADWKARHGAATDRERLLYEAVVGYETVDLLAPHRAPIRDDARVLLAPPTR